MLKPYHARLPVASQRPPEPQMPGQLHMPVAYRVTEASYKMRPSRYIIFPGVDYYMPILPHVASEKAWPGHAAVAPFFRNYSATARAVVDSLY